MDLTIAEAALLLERSPRAVRYMIHEGHLNAHRVGRTFMIRRADLPLSPRNAAQLQAQQEKLRSLVHEVLSPTSSPQTPSRDAASHLGTSQPMVPPEPSSALCTPASAPVSSGTPAIAGPPGLAGAPSERGLERPAPRYAVRSLELFRRTVGLYRALELVLAAPQAHRPAGPAEGFQALDGGKNLLMEALHTLREALQQLCAGLYHFEQRHRREHLERARESLAFVLVDLCLSASAHPETASLLEPLLVELEAHILPLLGGVLRKTGRTPRSGELERHG